jgi:hypothetical protein
VKSSVQLASFKQDDSAMARTIRFGGNSSSQMVRGGAGDLAPLLTVINWKKYVNDSPQFGRHDSIESLDSLDRRNYMACFQHWVGRVWIHHNPMPTGEEIAHFDMMSLEAEFRSYVKLQGTEFNKTALDLEECWATAQLRDAKPQVLFVEKHYAADLGPNVSRVELNSEQLVWLVAEICFRFHLNEPKLAVLVSDGYRGHTISVAGLSGIGYMHPRGIKVRPDWFVFADSYPSRSLLALEQNFGGAKAIEDVIRPPCWVVAPEDLNRVIVGFVLSFPEIEFLGDFFQCLRQISFENHSPLWSTFGFMLTLHDGYNGPAAKAGSANLLKYEELRKRFDLPSAIL